MSARTARIALSVFKAPTALRAAIRCFAKLGLPAKSLAVLASDAALQAEFAYLAQNVADPLDPEVQDTEVQDTEVQDAVAQDASRQAAAQPPLLLRHTNARRLTILAPARAAILGGVLRKSITDIDSWRAPKLALDMDRSLDAGNCLLLAPTSTTHTEAQIMEVFMRHASGVVLFLDLRTRQNA